MNLEFPPLPVDVRFHFPLLVVAGIFTHLLIKRVKGSPKYPPGPAAWPVVGNILSLSLQGAWISLTEFKKTYGDLIFFHGLGTTVLVVNSVEAIKDLLDKRAHNYSHRPVFTVVGELMGLEKGMPLQPYGDGWREQRKVAHTALSLTAVKQYHKLQEDLAMSLCESIIQNPADFFSQVRLTAGRIIIAVTYGINVTSAEDKYITMAEETMELIGKATVPGAYLCDILPILKYLPAWVPFRKEATMGKTMIEEFVSKPLKHVQREIASGRALPSLVRDLLTAEDVTPDYEHVVKWAAGSMYGAGAETTYATVLNFIMAMVLHPEKQRIAHEELVRVMGNGRVPQIRDRGNLPYVEAIIKETMRWHPALPLGLARRSDKDDWYNGFFVPKGTIIIPNVWAIAFSENEKYDPQDFIPERFLDVDDAAVDPTSYSFGFGRRKVALDFVEVVYTEVV
ncbi:hypothetical protein D9615_000792 [Tricholomella constricta]|uniref:Cytochrome P450 n=1 Tax=Tricholomella constricta TaxID=117010 RepID=A0A8H5HRW0_9AGAR|nr:hypothetical protein D9615_000792 [Tricholomella constricta]